MDSERRVEHRQRLPATSSRLSAPACLALSVLCSWACFALYGEWWSGRAPVKLSDDGLTFVLLAAAPLDDTWAWWLYSSRQVLFLIGAVLLLSVPLGALLGSLAAFAAPIYRALLARLVELSGALPALVLLGLWRLAQPHPSLLGLIGLLGGLKLVQVANLVTNRAQLLRQREPIEAARALGGTRWHLITVHVLPHLLPVLTVASALGAAWVVSIEAALSFVGLGLAEAPTWGGVLGEVAQGAAWSPAASAALLSIVAVSLSFFALGTTPTTRSRGAPWRRRLCRAVPADHHEAGPSAQASRLDS